MILEEIDPVVCPATFAVEKIASLPQRESKRKRQATGMLDEKNNRMHDGDDDDSDDSMTASKAFDMRALANVCKPMVESISFPLIEWGVSDDENEQDNCFGSSDSSSSSDASTSDDSRSVSPPVSQTHAFLDRFFSSVTDEMDGKFTPPSQPVVSSSSPSLRGHLHHLHKRPRLAKKINRYLVRSLVWDSHLSLLDREQQQSKTNNHRPVPQDQFSFLPRRPVVENELYKLSTASMP